MPRDRPTGTARALDPGQQDELLALAQKRAPDPTVFTQRPPFFYGGTFSNTRMDTYGTRMHPTSLKNYAAEADQGVAIQDSHDPYRLPMGFTLQGRFVGGQGNGESRAEMAAYTVPGLMGNGLDTSHLIDGIRAGMYLPLSITFYGGEHRCSACERDVFDADCPHIPGILYFLNGARAAESTDMPFVWVYDAHLAEISHVFHASTPGAAVSKIRALAAEDRLPAACVTEIRSRYALPVPFPTRTWAGVTVPAAPHPEAAPTGESTEERMDKAFVAWPEGRALLEPLGASEETDLLAACRLLAGAAAERATLQTQVDALTPLAEQGRQYRAHLLEEALAEGVRAEGDTFPKERYTALLAEAPLDHIRSFRDDWLTKGNARLGGGRQSSEASETPAPAPVPATPDRALQPR
jgi:hypothetical protein